jgi:hypothetical protein
LYVRNRHQADDVRLNHRQPVIQVDPGRWRGAERQPSIVHRDVDPTERLGSCASAASIAAASRTSKTAVATLSAPNMYQRLEAFRSTPIRHDTPPGFREAPPPSPRQSPMSHQ